MDTLSIVFIFNLFARLCVGSHWSRDGGVGVHGLGDCRELLQVTAAPAAIYKREPQEAFASGAPCGEQIL